MILLIVFTWGSLQKKWPFEIEMNEMMPVVIRHTRLEERVESKRKAKSRSLRLSKICCKEWNWWSLVCKPFGKFEVFDWVLEIGTPAASNRKSNRYKGTWLGSWGFLKPLYRSLGLLKFLFQEKMFQFVSSNKQKSFHGHPDGRNVACSFTKKTVLKIELTYLWTQFLDFSDYQEPDTKNKSH